MSRRLLIANGSSAGSTPPPDPIDPDPVDPGVDLGQWTVAVSDPETATLGYSIPTSTPYNVPDVMPLPVAGDGQTVHPSVLDFHPNTWNGHRYWMGVTSYSGGQNRGENPHIFYSDDAYEWTLPTGVPAPLVPSPGTPENPDQPFNADTELVYDPADDTLHLFYKVTSEISPTSEQIRHTSSANGSTWSTPVTVLSSTSYAVFQSPAIVRIPDAGWRMFAILGISGGTMRYWDADTLTGPWTLGGTCTLNGTSHVIWHVAAVRYGTRLYMACDGQGADGVYPAISDDYGLTWECGDNFITAQGWSSVPYRTSLFLHPELDKFRIWYSGVGGDGWRSGYTHAPKSLWDSLA